MAILPDKDLRARFGPVRDQDPRPTCMAFAASDTHAAMRPIWSELSVEWAYYHALKRGGTTPHAGATMTDMLAGIELDGQPDEGAWPYIPHLFTDMKSWTPPSAAPIHKRKSNSRGPTVPSLIQHLNADEPVLVTMSISSSFYNPDADGLVAGVEAVDPARRHAVIAVGHGQYNGDSVVLLRNSWGQAWGLQGYCWVTGNYLAPRLLRAATML